MNNPSPLVPQGSMLEQKNKNRARVRLAVFFVLSIHIVVLMALLMQGCRKPPEDQVPPVDTNAVPMEPVTDTNMSGATPPPGLAPLPEPTPAPAVVAPATQEYAVVKGDNFTTIAKKFGVTVKMIQEANPGVDSTKLKIGQKLQIPPPSAASGAATGTGTPLISDLGTGERVYTVKSGDTLTKIANQFGTTVKAIRAENSLTTDRIVVGQKMKIPAASAPVEAPIEPSVPSTAPAPVVPGPTGQ